MIALSLALPLVLAFSSVCLADHLNFEKVTWHVLDQRLPKPISDITATLASNGLVYIAGGCDAELGNVYNNDTGFFECGSISDSFYSFDPDTFTIKILENLPIARYRHSAAYTDDNRIWLVGGRNLTDAHVLQVDIYDINSATWSTPGSLPALNATSDHASFAFGDSVYVAGGYTEFYQAMANFFRLSLNGDNSLDIQELAPLLEARGDVKAVADEQFAYVSGGFTHVNFYCPSLDTVERYTVATDSWESLPNLQTGRGDKALVLLNGRLFALGGENQVQGLCDLTNPQPGEQTVIVDDVEVFEDGEWKILASIPERLFRFDAVAVDDENAIFAFGGQQAFNSTCLCYRSSDKIILYIDEMTKSGGTLSRTGWLFGSVVVVAVGLLLNLI